MAGSLLLMEGFNKLFSFISCGIVFFVCVYSFFVSYSLVYTLMCCMCVLLFSRCFVFIDSHFAVLLSCIYIISLFFLFYFILFFYCISYYLYACLLFRIFYPPSILSFHNKLINSPFKPLPPSAVSCCPCLVTKMEVACRLRPPTCLTVELKCFPLCFDL